MKNPTVIATIVIGLLAAVVTFLFVKKKSAPPPPGPKPTANYVIAKEAIPPRVPITDAMVEQQKVSGSQEADYCTSISEVVGKTVSEQIAKGAKIKKDAVSASEKVFPIPRERRGIALFLDPNLSAAGLLNVGDHVDVLVVYMTGEDAVARTVAQDCTVVSIDHPGASEEQPAGGAKAGGKAEAKGGGKAETKGTAPPSGQMLRVVLAVTPDDAVKITAATQKGDLRLSLRNPENLVSAPVEEEWEHPHRIHAHFPFPAPASPENIPKRPTGPGTGGAAPAAVQVPSTAATVPPVPFMRRIGIPAPPPGVTAKAKEKSVEVVRGTNKETVTVPE